MPDFIKKGRVPAVKNAVLIEGLPGIGNVSRISVEFLIDKLKAKKVCEIYSNKFPNSVIVDDSSLVKLFKVELYHAKIRSRDLLLLSGDCQPASEKDNYELSEFLINLIRKQVSELITLGGIGYPNLVKSPKIHCVVNNPILKKRLSKLNVVFDGNKTVRLIIGAAGLLLGLGSLYDINGFSLLVETFNHPQYVGIEESRELLNVLIDYLGVKISLKDLDDEIKGINEGLKKELKAKPDKQSYIG